jgi:hypothetical protein
MKPVLLIACLFVGIIANAQVTKFRTEWTAPGRYINKKWVWDDKDETVHILIVVDTKKAIISTYGKKEKNLSLLFWNKEDQGEGDKFITYSFEGVDDENKKWIGVFHLPINEKEYHYVLIMTRDDIGFKFAMDPE